jgi:protein phosphatase
VIVLDGEYVAFSAGDSRVYRYCGGVLRQMTEDDTLVAMAVRMGRMSPAEAMASSRRHYVTNASGSRNFRLHVGECEPLAAGDALLVCSDGLHSAVGLGRIEELLAAGGSARERCLSLVWAATKDGRNDDISVVVVNADSSADPAGGARD